MANGAGVVSSVVLIRLLTDTSRFWATGHRPAIALVSGAAVARLDRSAYPLAVFTRRSVLASAVTSLVVTVIEKLHGQAA